MNHDTDTPENDLPQDEQVSQAYQALNKETTPTALDEHILAAARREVGSRPQKVSFSRRWAIPVSVAAVIVLSVSLFTLHQVRIPMATAPAPAFESEPATIGTSSAPPMEEQEARSDAVERKQETLIKQRSVAKPMKSDMPEADVQQDKDSTASGTMTLEAAPALKKEKTITPASGRISDTVVPVEEQLARIRQLLKEGKQEEALLALKAFQQHNPDYQLSNDLQKLLE
jgi:hypothetical protein